ncbi:MAG: InlB B-repeat-containing protein, partial [Clostridia bacterium]
MKKRFYLLILFVLTAIMLIGCTNVNGNPIKSIEVMDVNSMVFELNEKIDYKNLKIRITYEDGTTRERQAFEWMTKGLDTTKLGERAFTVKYGKFIVTCKYEVVSQKYFTIKFDVQGGSDKVEDQEVFYKSTIVEPEVPSKEGFIFLGWYNGEVEFDIKTPIMQDYVLTAKWALDLEEYQMFVIRKINMMVELITKEVDYIPADYINIINIANEAIADIIASSTKEEIDNIYGNIQFAINNIPMIPQLLTIRFNEIIAGDYFVEDAAIIEGIYNEAVVAIDEYKNGVPTPYTIYLNAVKAMEEVFTKVEDIELSVFMKASRIKDMKFYANNKGEMYYTPMQWEALKVIVAGEVINIENAIGTREVAKAYAVALSKIDAAERLDEGRYNKVSELVVALNSYDINNYFVTEWMEMNEIYEDAIYGIRTYEGGVPSVEYIVSTAIAAMAEVNTKAEDKALAEIMKGTRLKDLAQYAQSKGEIYYSNENWTELMNLATITAAEYFSYC